MQVFRKRANGELYRPSPNRQGKYVLGDPRHGAEKHHAKNQVLVESLDEAVSLIEGKGFSLRMRGEITGQNNLISPSEIQIARTGAKA